MGDFMSLVRARMAEHAESHASRVREAALASEDRRKARERAKSHRRYSRLTPEDKLELSRKKKARMRELHGDGYFYEQNREWRKTSRGKASVDAYNGSEKHRDCQREYRARQREMDPEGYLERQREQKARLRHRRKMEALWLLVEWSLKE